MSNNDSSPASVDTGISFPNESAAYREARNALLAQEIELRRRIEAVASLRRALPAGGVVPEDYEFEAQGGATVRLSELFARPDASLVVYSLMYGPAMERACPSCTSILDALDGEVRHLEQRVNLAVVARSSIERIEAFARQRGWRALRLLSSARNSYNVDYHAETADGAQLPMLNVFVLRDGCVEHTYGTELMFAPTDPGQNPRHVDAIWPLWNVLDYTREGRGADWHPRLEYAAH